MRRLFAMVSLLAVAGCAAVSEQADGSLRFYYSTFDFSGDSYAAARKHCERRGQRVQHLGTECGFWTCVSRYVCSPM